MPPEELRRLPGYDPDIAKSRAEARAITQKLGYGPDKRLPVTVSTRNLSGYRDAAVILIDQLKEIYIDGQLETIDTTQWYPRIMRKDFTIGLNVSESAVDDPDQQFYENYVCTLFVVYVFSRYSRRPQGDRKDLGSADTRRPEWAA
jgi:peptide/nickel transport system substrate-binding protein